MGEGVASAWRSRLPGVRAPGVRAVADRYGRGVTTTLPVRLVGDGEPVPCVRRRRSALPVPRLGARPPRRCRRSPRGSTSSCRGTRASTGAPATSRSWRPPPTRRPAPRRCAFAGPRRRRRRRRHLLPQHHRGHQPPRLSPAAQPGDVVAHHRRRAPRQPAAVGPGGRRCAASSSAASTALSALDDVVAAARRRAAAPSAGHHRRHRTSPAGCRRSTTSSTAAHARGVPVLVDAAQLAPHRSAAGRRRLPGMERPQDVRAVRGRRAGRAPRDLRRGRSVPRRRRRGRPRRPRRGGVDRPARPRGGRLAQRDRRGGTRHGDRRARAGIGWAAIVAHEQAAGAPALRGRARRASTACASSGPASTSRRWPWPPSSSRTCPTRWWPPGCQRRVRHRGPPWLLLRPSLPDAPARSAPAAIERYRRDGAGRRPAAHPGRGAGQRGLVGPRRPISTASSRRWQ